MKRIFTNRSTFNRNREVESKFLGSSSTISNRKGGGARPRWGYIHNLAGSTVSWEV